MGDSCVFEDPLVRLQAMADELGIYFNSMYRAVPPTKDYDEETARVSLMRSDWHAILILIRDSKKVLDGVITDLAPPDPTQQYEGENIINLNHERQKRLNKSTERTKPL